MVAKANKLDSEGHETHLGVTSGRYVPWDGVLELRGCRGGNKRGMELETLSSENLVSGYVPEAPIGLRESIRKTKSKVSVSENRNREIRVFETHRLSSEHQCCLIEGWRWKIRGFSSCFKVVFSANKIRGRAWIKFGENTLNN